jgi:homoserine dehydrogenase
LLNTLKIILLLSLFSTINAKDTIVFAPLPMENRKTIFTQFSPMISYLEKQLNKKIKLFAISKKIKEGIYLGVRPVFIEKHNQLSKIDNEYNGIHLHSSLVGDLLFYGKGAGKFPTASAVFKHFK